MTSPLPMARPRLVRVGIAMPDHGAPNFADGLVSFPFGQADTAAELRFICSLDEAADGRFTRAANR